MNGVYPIRCTAHQALPSLQRRQKSHPIETICRQQLSQYLSKNCPNRRSHPQWTGRLPPTQNRSDFKRGPLDSHRGVLTSGCDLVLCRYTYFRRRATRQRRITYASPNRVSLFIVLSPSEHQNPTKESARYDADVNNHPFSLHAALRQHILPCA